MTSLIWHRACKTRFFLNTALRLSQAKRNKFEAQLAAQMAADAARTAEEQRQYAARSSLLPPRASCPHCLSHYLMTS